MRKWQSLLLAGILAWNAETLTGAAIVYPATNSSLVEKAGCWLQITGDSVPSRHWFPPKGTGEDAETWTKQKSLRPRKERIAEADSRYDKAREIRQGPGRFLGPGWPFAGELVSRKNLEV